MVALLVDDQRTREWLSDTYGLEIFQIIKAANLVEAGYCMCLFNPHYNQDSDEKINTIYLDYDLGYQCTTSESFADWLIEEEFSHGFDGDIVIITQNPVGRKRLTDILSPRFVVRQG